MDLSHCKEPKVLLILQFRICTVVGNDSNESQKNIGIFKATFWEGGLGSTQCLKITPKVSFLSSFSNKNNCSLLRTLDFCAKNSRFFWRK